jgi:hypothetical protein
MKKFLVKAILEPLAAILFCLAFGLPFVYFGFQSVDLSGEKDPQGVVTIEFTRKHYWGLWPVHEKLEDVQQATRKTSITHRSVPRRIRLTSGVILESQYEAVPLLAGSSNIDDEIKNDAIGSINDFIDDPTQTYFEKSICVRNVFGWVGLPFLILGALGLVGWPGSIFRYLRASS